MAGVLIMDAAKDMAADKMSKGEDVHGKEEEEDDSLADELKNLLKSWTDHEDNEVAEGYFSGLEQILESHGILEAEEEEAEEYE